MEVYKIEIEKDSVSVIKNKLKLSGRNWRIVNLWINGLLSTCFVEKLQYHSCELERQVKVKVYFQKCLNWLRIYKGTWSIYSLLMLPP